MCANDELNPDQLFESLKFENIDNVMHFRKIVDGSFLQTDTAIRNKRKTYLKTSGNSSHFLPHEVVHLLVGADEIDGLTGAPFSGTLARFGKPKKKF